MNVCGELLGVALRDGSAPIPYVDPSCLLIATAQGRSLLCTVMSLANVPIVTFAIAPEGSDGAMLWSILHEGANSPLATKPDKLPWLPWLAVRLEVGAALHSHAMGWLDEFERCCGWAWIDHQDGK